MSGPCYHQHDSVHGIIRLLEDPDNQVFEEIKSVIVENFGEFSGELTRRLYSGECSDIEKMRIAEVAQLSISRIFLNEFQNYTARLTPEPSLLAGTVMIEKIADNTFNAIMVAPGAIPVWMPLAPLPATVPAQCEP